MSAPLRAAIVGLTGIGGGRAPAVDGPLRWPRPMSHAGAYVAEARTELVAVRDQQAVGRGGAAEGPRRMSVSAWSMSGLVSLPRKCNGS